MLLYAHVCVCVTADILMMTVMSLCVRLRVFACMHLYVYESVLCPCVHTCMCVTVDIGVEAMS